MLVLRTITSTAIIAPPDYRLSPLRCQHDVPVSAGGPHSETSRKRLVRVLEPITKIREKLTSCKRIDPNVDNIQNYV